MRPDYLPILEKDIEQPVVNYYKSQYRKLDREGQPLVRKMNGAGYRSWEDRLFIGPWGRVLWIEFKRPGEKASPLQANHHAQMHRMGHKSNVVDNVSVGKRLVDALFCDLCARHSGLKGWFYNIELCDECSSPDALDFELVEVT